MTRRVRARLLNSVKNTTSSKQDLRVTCETSYSLSQQEVQQQSSSEHELHHFYNTQIRKMKWEPYIWPQQRSSMGWISFF